MTTTKSDLVNAVAEANGFAQNKSAEIVKTLINLIKTKLVAGEDVLISGFGKFCVKEKRERQGRNPGILRGRPCNYAFIMHNCTGVPLYPSERRIARFGS